MEADEDNVLCGIKVDLVDACGDLVSLPDG